MSVDLLRVRPLEKHRSVDSGFASEAGSVNAAFASSDEELALSAADLEERRASLSLHLARLLAPQPQPALLPSAAPPTIKDRFRKFASGGRRQSYEVAQSPVPVLAHSRLSGPSWCGGWLANLGHMGQGRRVQSMHVRRPACAQ